MKKTRIQQQNGKYSVQLYRVNIATELTKEQAEKLASFLEKANLSVREAIEFTNDSAARNGESK